jgi:hypothetical protein
MTTQAAAHRPAISLRGIGFESCAISQIPNVDGVSSTSVIDTANQGGQKLYLADSTNWTTTVRPNLTGYTTQVLDDLTTWYINAGWKLLIHENGSTQRHSYHGYGIYAISPYGGVVGLINGYLQGGTGSDPQTPAENNENAAVQQKRPDNLTRTEVGKKFVEDVDFHVDTKTGHMVYEHVDYHDGAGAFPHGLPFIRYYNVSDVNNLTYIGRPGDTITILLSKRTTSSAQQIEKQTALAAALQLVQSALGALLLTGVLVLPIRTGLTQHH